MKPIIFIFFLTILIMISACNIIENANDNPVPNNNDLGLFECNKLPLVKEDLAISYPRYSCYLAVAVQEKDIGICEYIEDDFKYRCYERVGISSGNISICNKLQTQLSKEACYHGVAKTNSDAYVCEMIEEKTGQDYCYLGVSQVSSNLELCEKMNFKSESAFYPECKKNIAININDGTICEEIGWVRFRDECFLELKICAKITAPDLYQKCLSYDVDLSSCGNADDTCFFSIATKILNSNVCSRITNIDIKYECYRDIAVDTNNVTICENMQWGVIITESAIERSTSRCKEDVISGNKDSTFY